MIENIPHSPINTDDGNGQIVGPVGTEAEKKLFGNLEYYMNETLESYPDEQELERIVFLAERIKAYRANVGIRSDRIKDNPREKAFHDEWLKENEPDSCGNGLLQGLFIDEDIFPSIIRRRKVLEIITERDRRLVATVIQWLGSNCGMAFLQASLKRFGAKISYQPQE